MSKNPNIRYDAQKYFEAVDDNLERRVLLRGLNKTSLWLPGNLMCNSRHYVDPELKARLTSEVRNVTNDPALEIWKLELIEREAKRNKR